MHRPSTRAGGWLRLMVGVLALGGLTCASAGAAAAAPGLYGVVSGSRLRAQFYDGGGGAIVFGGWFDSQLGIPCVFMRSCNGQMRCLPAGQPAVWMDATCTMPVWPVECRESLPRYVTALVSQGAAPYVLGEPYTGAVRATGNNTGGWERSCLDIVGKGGGSYYGMSEIPSESFVAATIRSAPIDDGKLFVRTVESEDGSSQVGVEVNGRFVRHSPQLSAFPAGTFSFLGSGRLRAPSYVEEDGPILVGSADGFIDAESNDPCRPVRFADGLRCVPWRVATLNTSGPYLDAGCTALLSETRPRSPWGPTTTGAPAVARSTCSVAMPYTLGDVVTPAFVYFKWAACEPRTPVAGVVYREAIPALDIPWAPVAERSE